MWQSMVSGHVKLMLEIADENVEAVLQGSLEGGRRCVSERSMNHALVTACNKETAKYPSPSQLRVHITPRIADLNLPHTISQKNKRLTN